MICEDLRHVCGKCGFKWPERSAYDALVLEILELKEKLKTSDEVRLAAVAHAADLFQRLETCREETLKSAARMIRRQDYYISNELLARYVEGLDGDAWRPLQQKIDDLELQIKEGCRYPNGCGIHATPEECRNSPPLKDERKRVDELVAALDEVSLSEGFWSPGWQRVRMAQQEIENVRNAEKEADNERRRQKDQG